MTENQQSTPQQVVQKQPNFLCTIIKTLIASLILSIIIEWLCITFVWPEQGAMHSKNVMKEEFGWFSAQFQQSLLYSYPVILAEQTIVFIHEWLFIKTGLQTWLHNTPQDAGVSTYIWFYARSYIESTLYVIIIFIIRLLIIILTSPLFILVAIVGLTDGLVQRDLRRFGVGRESAFKYHHAKKSVAPVMFMAWIIYLAIPISIHPNLILIPAAILFGIMIALTASNFKKYL